MRRRGIQAVPEDGPALRPEFTVLSDLSANVFAALLLILVVLLEVRSVASRPAPPPRPLDAMADLGADVRRPLRAGQLVALLKDRNEAAPGLSIDLGARDLALTGDGATQSVPIDSLEAALHRLRPGAPVRLYVFSQTLYGPVAAQLRKSGVTATELSVPRALRGPDGGWSPEFISLADTPGSLDAFREGLARLLAAAPGPLVPDGHVAGDRAGGPGGGGGGSEAPLSRLLRALGLMLGAAALGGAILVVALTEWLVPPGPLRYRGERSRR